MAAPLIEESNGAKSKKSKKDKSKESKKSTSKRKRSGDDDNEDKEAEEKGEQEQEEENIAGEDDHAGNDDGAEDAATSADLDMNDWNAAFGDDDDDGGGAAAGEGDDDDEEYEEEPGDESDYDEADAAAEDDEYYEDDDDDDHYRKSRGRSSKRPKKDGGLGLGMPAASASGKAGKRKGKDNNASDDFLDKAMTTLGLPRVASTATSSSGSKGDGSNKPKTEEGGKKEGWGKRKAKPVNVGAALNAMIKKANTKTKLPFVISTRGGM